MEVGCKKEEEEEGEENGRMDGSLLTCESIRIVVDMKRRHHGRALTPGMQKYCNPGVRIELEVLRLVSSASFSARNVT